MDGYYVIQGHNDIGNGLQWQWLRTAKRQRLSGCLKKKNPDTSQSMSHQMTLSSDFVNKV